MLRVWFYLVSILYKKLHDLGRGKIVGLPKTHHNARTPRIGKRPAQTHQALSVLHGAEACVAGAEYGKVGVQLCLVQFVQMECAVFR